MLKGVQKEDFQFHQKPRKLIKLNIQQDQNYNQFKGEFIQDYVEPNNQRTNKTQQQVNLEEESKRNKSIFQAIKSTSASQYSKIRSIKDASKPKIISVPQVKVQEQVKKDKAQGTEKAKPNDTKQKQQVKKPKQNANGLSNWQQFLSKSASQPSNIKPKSSQKLSEQFIAIDCQFVKHKDEQLLARVSLVNQKGQCKLDTYVHPDKKITDYVTEISGITYGHIKNAPNTKSVIENVKSIIYNKIVVGHTVWKDLQVCGLKEWKGCKAVVDISEFNEFQEKSGKLISLKNLSLKYLGKKIQDGRHSSTEDAQATMSLFLLKKKEMLKRFKVIV